MQTLKNSLLVALLAIACVVGLQISCLIAQTGTVVSQFGEEGARALANLNQTLDHAKATLRIARESAAEQRGYYESIARYSARSLANLSQLIDRSDARLERATVAAEQALAAGGASANALAAQAGEVSSQARLLLLSATASMQNLERLTASPELEQSNARLAGALANLEKTTAATAEAASSLRDILSPRKKGFWRHLFEWLIPRPTIAIHH